MKIDEKASKTITKEISVATKEIRERRNSKEALEEQAFLRDLNSKPLKKRWRGYLKLTGPATMEAATTLGAGSFLSATTLGAAYGYDMLWVPLYSYGLGLFMLALASRFVSASDVPVIEAQDRYHNKLIGKWGTGLIGCYIAMLVFSFGQYALGTDALQQLFSVVGVNFPRSINWTVILVLSSILSLIYGRSVKCVKYVENVMKCLIGLMLLCFLAVVFKTGINWNAAIKGLLIPTLPKGIEGITMAIAGLTAAMGVMDWVQYHYSMHARGYTEEHERVARFDTIVGGLLPVTLVLCVISIAFAEVFSGQPSIPTDSSQLAAALVSVLPSNIIKVAFYLGVVAIVISTMVGLNVLAATTFCQCTGLKQDTSKWYWKVLILSPQIGFLGAFIGKPLWAAVTIAALQSIFNWMSGVSWYLLGNDKRYLGERRIKSRLFNIGILLCIVVLNLVFVTFILTKIGVWPE